MIYHAAHFTNSHLDVPSLEAIFNGKFGYYGVMVFFVLSGFLMEGASRRYDAKKFLLHRFLTLFPTYWLLFCLNASHFFCMQLILSAKVLELSKFLCMSQIH